MGDHPNPNLEPLRPERESEGERATSGSPRLSRPERPDRPGDASSAPPERGGNSVAAGGSSRSGTSGEPASGGGQAAPPRSPLNRRALFSLLGVAVLGAVLVPRIFHSNQPTLPVPAGQVMTAEYRTATLAFKPAPTTPMPADHSTWKSCAAGGPSRLSNMDLVLVIDTTGSMGPVIEDVKASVFQLLNALQAGGGSVRVGAVAYRDMGDDYVVRQYPLTEITGAGMSGLTSFIGGLVAWGGGDWPEKVDAGVQTAAAMDWRPGVPGSIVVIGDAPDHDGDSSSALSAATSFHKTAGHEVSVIDAGSGAHPFMQALPSAGGGQYVTYDGHILNSLFPAITGCASH